MAKPIFIVRLPSYTTQAQKNETQKYMREYLTEYYVIVAIDYNRPEGVAKFECYNTDNVEKVDLGKIKILKKRFKIFP